jgi:hypothetical protein
MKRTPEMHLMRSKFLDLDDSARVHSPHPTLLLPTQLPLLAFQLRTPYHLLTRAEYPTWYSHAS